MTTIRSAFGALLLVALSAVSAQAQAAPAAPQIITPSISH